MCCCHTLSHHRFSKNACVWLYSSNQLDQVRCWSQYLCYSDFGLSTGNALPCVMNLPRKCRNHCYRMCSWVLYSDWLYWHTCCTHSGAYAYHACTLILTDTYLHIHICCGSSYKQGGQMQSLDSWGRQSVWWNHQLPFVFLYLLWCPVVRHDCPCYLFAFLPLCLMPICSLSLLSCCLTAYYQPAGKSLVGCPLTSIGAPYMHAYWCVHFFCCCQVSMYQRHLHQFILQT